MDNVSTDTRKILVVEDDVMILNFVAVLLDSEGYEVVKAENGEEMFAALAEHDFDLIVLDIMLPDGNGVEFARRLRSTNTTVPIVFATGVTDMDTRRHAAGLMQIDYITKPFQAEQLLDGIQAMFDGSPIMEAPVDESLPPPVAADETPWYGAPLVWAPALALILIVAVGLFVIPKDEGPALPQFGANGAGGPGAVLSPEEEEARAAKYGLVLKDAAPTGTGGQGAAAGSANSEGAGNAGGNSADDANSAEVLEQKIISACGQLPVSDRWTNNSVKRVLRNVKFVYKGEWRAYLEFWENRLRTTQDLYASGQPIEIGGETIGGTEMGPYIDLMIERVRYIRCAQRIVRSSN